MNRTAEERLQAELHELDEAYQAAATSGDDAACLQLADDIKAMEQQILDARTDWRYR